MRKSIYVKRLQQEKNLSGAPSVKTGINYCSQRFWFLRKVERQNNEGITWLQTLFFSEPDFTHLRINLHVTLKKGIVFAGFLYKY